MQQNNKAVAPRYILKTLIFAPFVQRVAPTDIAAYDPTDTPVTLSVRIRFPRSLRTPGPTVPPAIGIQPPEAEIPDASERRRMNRFAPGWFSGGWLCHSPALARMSSRCLPGYQCNAGFRHGSIAVGISSCGGPPSPS